MEELQKQEAEERRLEAERQELRRREEERLAAERAELRRIKYRGQCELVSNFSHIVVNTLHFPKENYTDTCSELISPSRRPVQRKRCKGFIIFLTHVYNSPPRRLEAERREEERLAAERAELRRIKH